MRYVRHRAGNAGTEHLRVHSSILITECAAFGEGDSDRGRASLDTLSDRSSSNQEWKSSEDEGRREVHG